MYHVSFIKYRLHHTLNSHSSHLNGRLLLRKACAWLGSYSVYSSTRTRHTWMGVRCCGKVVIRNFDLQKVGQGLELQHRQIRRWMTFFHSLMAYKTVKRTAYLSQTVFLWSTNVIHTHTHTYTYTYTDKPTIAIGENACNASHFA